MRWRAAHYRTEKRFEFEVEKGRVVARRATRGAVEFVFGPGFVDLQCNGFAGVDFNHRDFRREQAGPALEAMWRHGTTHVLPSIITAEPARMEDGLRELAAARQASRHTIIGFHVEGPFLSPEEGARGAHPLAAIRPIEPSLWRRLQHAAEGGITLLTLAPELKGAAAFIRRLRAENVIPAVGHTLATFAEIERAATAGALLSTHLGNGCPQSLPRHANPIFAQLGCDALAASFIADGIHLPPEVFRSLLRAKGLPQSILVTDAMAAAGAPPGRYTIGDQAVEVGSDRIVRQPGQPNFAGSALTMDQAVARTARMAGLSLADAWDAASLRPWNILRQARPTLPKRHSGWVIARLLDALLEVQAAFHGPRLLWQSPALPA